MNYGERRKLQASQTEQRILQAALDLMREHGYENVSVRDICARAGITTGAFYHHFPSKEALIAKGFGALDHYVAQALEGHEEEEPARQLLTILTAYAEFMERESGELTARYYLVRLSNVQAGVRLDPSRFTQRAMVKCFDQAKLRGEFPADRSSQWAAAFCYRHFRGIVIDWVLSGYAYPLQERMLEDFRVFRQLFGALPVENAE